MICFYELQSMFKILVGVLLLVAANSRLLEASEIRGTLKIKQNQFDKGTVNKILNVRAALSSAQISNIVHQGIKVIIPSPSHGCSPFQLSEDIAQSKLPVYFLISGADGECSYARKVDMAKKALGKGAIIIDSPKGINNLKLRLNQKDRFVSLLISEEEGTSLSHSSSFLAELNMVKSGDQNTKANSIQIWVSSLNEESYKVLHQWKDALKEIPSLEQKTSWSPRFAFYSSENGNNLFVSSCACGGQFCSPEQQSKSSNVLVREDIRQYLIFKENPEKYLKYVKKFYDNCFDNYLKTQHAEDCATGLIHDLEIKQSINLKIDHFLTECQDQNDEENFLLYQSLALDRAKYNQIGHYPTVILNHEQLQFRSSDQLRSLLCRKLSMQQQTGCAHITESTTIMTIVSWIFYFLMIVLLIGAGAFAVLFFRNKLRREMNKQLKMQVSTAVEHYFTLSEVQ